MTASRVANSNPLVEGAPSWLESTLETVALFFSFEAVQELGRSPPAVSPEQSLPELRVVFHQARMNSKTVHRQSSLDVFLVTYLSAATIAGTLEVSAGVTCLVVHTHSLKKNCCCF